MTLKVSIHQPHYLPWAPYIYKIIHSDTFVFLDDVQFDRSDYQHRNYISKKSNRWLLTIPVKHDSILRNINESKIINSGWKRKHLKSIYQTYSRKKYFQDAYPLIENLIEYPNNNLADFNINFVSGLLNYLDINTKLVRSSELSITSKKEQKVLDILKKLNATTYISGKESYFNYLDITNFQKSNINIKLIDYNFESLYDKDTILNLLFSYSPKVVVKILNHNGREENP